MLDYRVKKCDHNFDCYDDDDWYKSEYYVLPNGYYHGILRYEDSNPHTDVILELYYNGKLIAQGHFSYDIYGEIVKECYDFHFKICQTSLSFEEIEKFLLEELDIVNSGDLTVLGPESNTNCSWCKGEKCFSKFYTVKFHLSCTNVI